MKLSPVSIPYRGFQKASSLLVAVFFVSTAGVVGVEVATAAGAFVVLAAVGYEVAYYRRFNYELTEDTLDISSGVIARREREIPYGRIQNVDISRNVLQRLLGVAAVELETAGGSSTEGVIRYVTAAEATRLQREVQRRKASIGREPGSAAGSELRPDEGVVADEEDLFALSPSELALVGALSFDPRLVGLLAFLASGSVPVLSGVLPALPAFVLTVTGLVVVGTLLVASWALGAAVAISNYYGFRLSRAGDELRYERGLFRRYSGSIPTEKVQSLTISDNPAKRLFGYATLTIETAGYAPGQGGTDGNQAAVPLAGTDRAFELAREVEAFGDPDFRRPPNRVRVRYAIRYLLVVLGFAAVAFAVEWYVAVGLPWFGPLAALPLVPIAAHYRWKHRGFWLGEDHLITRIGFWKRETRVVPYYRIQTVIDTRTVFQRRWDVATVVADTAGAGGLVGRDAAAVDVDSEDADRLRTELTDRLQTALVRRRTRRDRRDRFERFDGAGPSHSNDEGTPPVGDREPE